MADLKEIAELVKAEHEAKAKAQGETNGEVLQAGIGMEQTYVNTTSIIRTPAMEEAIAKQAEAQAAAVAAVTETEDDSLFLEPSPEELVVEAPAAPAEEPDLIAELQKDLTKKSTGTADEAVAVTNTEVEGKHVMTLEEFGNKLKEDIKKCSVPEDSADIEYNAIMTILTRKRKQFLIEEGFDENEIEEALMKRYDREIEALKNKYSGKGSTVVIEVPSTDADKIEFTDDQQAKLDKSSKIHLVKIDTKEIPVSHIKKLSKPENKLKMVQAMNTSYVSKYTVPAPLTGEFVTLKGALMVELLQARSESNESLQSTVSKKASLVYRHYVDGVTHKLKNESGATVMSYSDFINQFRYHDLDLMVYGVACASSAPLSVSELSCGRCSAKYSHEFSLSSLLDMSTVPESIMANYEDIIKHHSELRFMESLKDKQDELLRVQSPITNNIYDIGSPSIARTINILGLIDEENATDFYIGAIDFFTHGVYIYDKDEDNYIEFTPDEYEEVFQLLKSLPQAELAMLHDMTINLLYNIQFTMHSKCPECGAEMTNDIPINDLIFFVTPETPTEIKK